MIHMMSPRELVAAARDLGITQKRLITEAGVSSATIARAKDNNAWLTIRVHDKLMNVLEDHKREETVT